MNWDDLRIVLAVRDSGTYAGAAARLRIDETTVARRLARLQQDIGVALFNAVDGMREPTSHCTAILAHAQEIARHVERIGEVGRSTQGPAGRFRIATTSSIAEELLAPAAAELLAASPGLTLQFMTSSENVNFFPLGGRHRNPPAKARARRFHDRQAR
jgi:DNA-binding transcriptional LysR family regulator